MSTALYRRYRSATFADLIGQDHMATTLRSQIRDGKVAHAYLFAGMRGTGKTSTARILARAVNCENLADGEPCNNCTACNDITGGATVDVLEIDAASNRGIDEMRDLRDKVKFLPAALKRKVYIIDEAHMLTNEAWNAMLKTLEEPPEHVLFILATTEPHKIPETVRSRVQRFDFRRVSTEGIAGHLSKVAQAEGFTVDEDAATLLARASQGSVRDALSLLEQSAVSADGRVTLEAARTSLGYADTALMEALVDGMGSGDAAAVLSSFDAAIEAGADPRQLLREVGRVARAASLVAIGYKDAGRDENAELARKVVMTQPDARWWLAALDRIAQAELALRQPVDARLQVEQSLLQITCGLGVPAGSVTVPSAPAVVASAPLVPAAAPSSPASPLARPPSPPSSPEPQPIAAASPANGSTLTTVEQWTAAWPRLVEAVNRRREVSLAGVLRDCKPIECKDNSLTIGAMGTFHLERLKDPVKLAALTEAVAEVGGQALTVDSVFVGKKEAAGSHKAPGQEVTEAVLETFAGSRIVSSRMKEREP